MASPDADDLTSGGAVDGDAGGGSVASLGSEVECEVDIIDDASKGLDVCGDLFRRDPIRSTPVTTSLYPGRASARSEERRVGKECLL